MGDKGVALFLWGFFVLFCFQSMSAQAVLAQALEILGKEKIPQLESYRGQASILATLAELTDTIPF